MTHIGTDTALIVIDAQKGFDDEEYWGPRNNPEAEANIARLVAHARRQGWLVVAVQHASKVAGSPLSAGTEGFEPKDPQLYASADLRVVKSVHAAFFGKPDLHQELQARGVSRIVVTGITTNFCVETTSRVGSDLGYEVVLPLDATHTFDRFSGRDQRWITADEIAAVTAANLDREFATVTSTDEVVR
ncbi:MAG: isochorismatase family protein [Segniliparus sp.]|uniref:isochorismatase family protein n=1 Tax=Segniliparus sp. TaxID=2804064 RepID=UPI003F2E2F73